MNAKIPADHRPSLRLLVAAARLRDGESPQRVADTTRVPLALVQLLAEELHDRETRQHHHEHRRS